MNYYAIMTWDGGKMTYSRVKKYQELRDGLKEEVGISNEKYVETKQVEDDDDDFLSFMKKKPEEDEEVNLEDTLTETKTFEQMREEGSAELDKALKSAKESVGKEDEYNTRMDILNKIREPEKNTIKVDSVESYETEEFSKGMFVNNEVEESPKEKMTFMEKLAAMSPKEDAKKAEEFLQQDSSDEEIVEENEEIEDEEVEVEEENTLIEENDDQEIEVSENKGESKVVKVMNVIIVILVIVFIALLGLIVYQSFLG